MMGGLSIDFSKGRANREYVRHRQKSIRFAFANM
jgi:hypothetical protein